MRKILGLLLVLALGSAVLIADSAFVEITADDVDDVNPNDDITITTAADSALVVISIIGDIGTPSISDNQDNVWETVITQDGSGHRLYMYVKCDTSAAAYTITLTSAGAAHVATYAAEYSGIVTSACIQDSGGGQSASQSTPLDGADVDTTGAARIVGAGVSTTDLTADTGTETRDEAVSATTINLNFADKRATGAGTWDLDWTFAGTVPTLNIVAALTEVSGGSTFQPAIIGNNPVGRGGARLRQVVQR